MTLQRVLAAALTAGSVAACTVGPNFQPPAAPATSRYTSPDENPGQGVALGATAADAAWWHMFRSPALDRVVRQAIGGNPSLDAAKARLAAGQEALRAADSGLFPQVTLNAGVAREKLSATSFGLQPGAFPLPPNFNLYQIGPSVSYALDVFGGTRRQIERQTALAELRRQELNATYMTLTGNTVMQALQVAAARAQLKAVDSILALDQQNITLVRNARAAGSVPDSDVVIAESQLAADRALRPPLEQQLSVARHALAVLVGEAPGNWVPPDFDLAGLTLARQIPVSLPSALVHQRPDILAAEASLHAASAQVGVATAQLYPNITLSAGITAASLDPGRLFSPASLVWSMAAGLTAPIFDGGLREAERRQALDDFKATAADYRQTVLAAFQQVADVMAALAHDSDLLAAQQQALTTALDSVNLQRFNYSHGGTGLINLLDAQRQYQRALQGFIRADAQRYLDAAALLVAMGRGWSEAKLTAPPL